MGGQAGLLLHLPLNSPGRDGRFSVRFTNGNLWRYTEYGHTRTRQQREGGAMRSCCLAGALYSGNENAGMVLANCLNYGVGGCAILDKTADRHLSG